MIKEYISLRSKAFHITNARRNEQNEARAIVEQLKIGIDQGCTLSAEHHATGACWGYMDHLESCDPYA